MPVGVPSSLVVKDETNPSAACWSKGTFALLPPSTLLNDPYA